MQVKKFYHGIYKSYEGLNILQLVDDIDCLNCEIASGGFGIINAFDYSDAERVFKEKLPRFANIQAFEINTINHYEYTPVF